MSAAAMASAFAPGALVRTKIFGHRYQVLRVRARRDGSTLIVCRPIDVAEFHHGHFYFDPEHLEPVGAA